MLHVLKRFALDRGIGLISVGAGIREISATLGMPDRSGEASFGTLIWGFGCLEVTFRESSVIRVELDLSYPMSLPSVLSHIERELLHTPSLDEFRAMVARSGLAYRVVPELTFSGQECFLVEEWVYLIFRDEDGQLATIQIV